MAERLHLRPKHRQVLEALLQEHLPGVEVWACGSRASGRSHDGSDLDLVLRGPDLKEIPIGRLGDFEEAVRESTIPFLVEARDWTRLPERFHREIERHHVVLVAGDGRNLEGKRSGLKGEWRTTTLGDVVTLQRGFDLPTTERKLGSYPVIASTGPVGTHNRAVVQGPGVVIGRSGSLGGGQFIKQDFWPLNTTLWVKDFNNNDPRFCYFLLKSLDLGQFNAGSGVPTLNRNHIHPLPVRVPPLPEQRAIAHILGTLDDKIELNRRMNETLEAMARALFKSWFVDFAPVRAKMAGRDPGLPQPLADLFPDRLVNSELGEIPEGWEVMAFGDLLDDVIGGDWGKETPDLVHTDPVSVIRGTDLPDIVAGGVGAVPLRYTTKKKAKRRILKDGDIVIEVSGGSPTQSTGRTVIITTSILDRFPSPVVCASFCRRLRPSDWRKSLLASQHLDFIYLVGKMWSYQLQSTGIANFQTKLFLQNERIIWPGDDLTSKFAEFVGPIVRLASQNESITLAALRDALLAKLVSGKLRVNDTEVCRLMGCQ